MRATAPLLRSPGEWPFAVHLLLLTFVAVVVGSVWRLDSAFTSDEGAYGWQVAALEEGSWSDPYALPDLPWHATRYPLANSTADAEGRWYPYVKHPAWPAVLHAASAGDPRGVGLHLPSAGCAVLGAALAWMVAAALGGARSRPVQATAFWLAASGPLLVHGGLLWAHAASAAAAGVAILAGIHLVQRGLRVATAAALATAVAAGVLVRSEGLLLAGALAVGLAVAAWRQAQVRTAVATVALTLGPAVAAVVAERAWIDSIVEGTTPSVRLRGDQTASGWLEGRFTGAWHELFGGSYGEPLAAALALIAAVGLLFAVVGINRGAHNDAKVGVGIAVLSMGARLILFADEPITGLFIAWPVAIAGVACAGWRKASPAMLAAGMTGILYVGAVLLTQYPEGGGLEWGGRFFSPLIVPIAAVGALGLVRLISRAEQSMKVAIVALTVVWGVAGPMAVGQMRARVDLQVAEVGRPGSPVVVTDLPALPRLAWRTAGETTWLLSPAHDVAETLSELADAGVEQVTVVVSEPDAELGDAFPQRRTDGILLETDVSIQVLSR